MRENKLKRMIKEGKAAIGTLLPTGDPNMVEFLGLLGYDFYFIDCEHGGFGLETASSLVRAAQSVGMEPVVRALTNDPAVILGYLEVGAYTIVVPHCSTAEAVRRALAAIKYPPHSRLGQRLLGGQLRSGDEAGRVHRLGQRADHASAHA